MSKRSELLFLRAASPGQKAVPAVRFENHNWQWTWEICLSSLALLSSAGFSCTVRGACDALNDDLLTIGPYLKCEALTSECN